MRLREKLERFHDRWKDNPLYSWLRQIGWFGVVGAAATATYAGTVAGAIEWLAVSRQAANLLALVFSSACSYFGHRYLTFQVSGSHGTYFPRFAVQIVATFLVSSVLTYAAENWGLHYAVGIVFVCVIIPAANFLVMRLWTFAHRQTPER